MAGVFVPDDPALWGAPRGMRRLVFYALCEPCFAIDPNERAERIERAIAARFAPAGEAAA